MNFKKYFKLAFLFFGLLLLSCSKDEPKKSKEAKIISWKFGDKTATIKGTDISFSYPFGTDITKLTATVEISAKASINPDPKTIKDYTSPKEFTVTAEDGTTKQTYKVMVTVAKNKKAEITSWKFGDKTATIKGTNISFSYPFGTDITKLNATATISAKASISPDPKTIKDYTKPIDFEVTAEDGTTKQKYKVTVTVEKAILLWTAGWRNDKAHKATIDHSKAEIKINVTSSNFKTKVNLLAGVVISPDPNKVDDWEREVSFTVSKGSIEKKYKVKVTVNGKDIIKAKDSDIKSIVNTEITKLSNTGDFNHIDVSSVTNMKDLFKDKKSFNGDISKWDVSKVTNMQIMFYAAEAFNQDIGDWDVSKVNNMNSMFWGAASFNQDIGNWNVSNVNYMGFMFRGAKAFNQDIGKWNVSKVTNMQTMFYAAETFNQDIGSWNVSNVINMAFMFSSAYAFNQNIGNWNVSKVTNMSIMFSATRAFNQNISKWNVSNVIDMRYMFYGAYAFNQNISKWNVSKVTDMGFMFSDSKAFNQDISKWTVTQVTNCKDFSKDATVFTDSNKPKFTKCTP